MMYINNTPPLQTVKTFQGTMYLLIIAVSLSMLSGTVYLWSLCLLHCSP